MKQGRPLTIAVALAFISAITFSRAYGQGNSTRTLVETLIRGTGGGSGGGYPSCFFGEELLKLEGNSKVYSYTPADWPDGPPDWWQMDQADAGSASSNTKVWAHGNCTIAGKVKLPEDGIWEQWGNIHLGTKLDPPRVPDNPSNPWESGSPAAPGDPGYQYFEAWHPQWDQDNDGDTDGADYDWVIQNQSIEFTQPGDPTIRKDNNGQPGDVASTGGKWADYLIENNNIIIKGNKRLHFTGENYRFNTFEVYGNTRLYFGTGGNESDLYCMDYYDHGNFRLIISSEKHLAYYIRDSFCTNGNIRLNENGQADQFDLVSPASNFTFSGNISALAGSFYAPNANMDISGNCSLYMAIVAREIIIRGNATVCYPNTYQGPPGSSGVSPPTNPPETKDWREIITTN